MTSIAERVAEQRIRCDPSERIGCDVVITSAGGLAIRAIDKDQPRDIAEGKRDVARSWLRDLIQSAIDADRQERCGELERRVGELEGLLREVEWTDHGECPSCRSGWHNHADGCRIAAALERKA